MILLLLVTFCLVGGNRATHSNHFAIHVPAGLRSAAALAEKHGFEFHGQVGSLPNYYLIEHARHKQTHAILRDESHVSWFQQQRARTRRKRDFDYTSFVHDYDGRKNRETPLQTVFTDPLFKEQWYLNGGAKDGYDMNLVPAWKKGYTGKGVVVSILDDGIQTNHPDLALNYDSEASTDINDNDDDPMPRDNGDNKHGTRCAGEVAAVAFNRYCGIGVAYNASIGGVRMLDGSVNDVVEARALGLNPDHIDIYSASWGPEDDGKTVDGPGPLARRAFIYGVTSGRQGKGSIFVWASGNGGRHTDSCNCDGYTNSIFTLSISSATQGGYKPWYLEECSSTLASTYSSGTPGNDKSVTTVDMDATLREDHICTVEHTGTSASAPLAAGICALALEANPNLTWRDMQYLTVLTSRSPPLEKESGWIANGVKRKVSHKFGYGLMDAGAMVSLAEQWTSVPVQRICKSQEINEDRQIDPVYGYTLSVTMDVNGCAQSFNEVRFLEHVQCKVSLRFFPRGNLRLLLISPMGTTSTLLFERPRDVLNSNFDDWPFLSVHFWGEKAEGRWTLQVINAGGRHVNSPGILKKWQLIFYGTSSNPIRIRSRQLSSLSYMPTGTFGYVSNPYSFLKQRLFTDYYDDRSRKNARAVSVYAHDSGATKLVKSANQLQQQSCDSQCDKQGCYGEGPTKCLKCANYKFEETCLSQCPGGSFVEGNSRLCVSCHESCGNCTGQDKSSCVNCAPSYLRVSDLGICLLECPDGYYLEESKRSCELCDASCATCSNQSDECTSCESHMFLYQRKCYETCPPRSYRALKHHCETCHPNCDSCSGPNLQDCLKCRVGLFLQNGRCLRSCSENFVPNIKNRKCLPIYLQNSKNSTANST